QSTTNTVNCLMGVGLLALPFALSRSGWVPGIAMMMLFGFAASYTAKLIARCMDVADIFLPGTRRMRDRPMTLGDVGDMAFGDTGRAFVTGMFVLELAAAAVAFLILFSDTLCLIFPTISLVHAKILGAIIVLPTTYPKSLSFLSYGSVVGILAMVNIAVILLWDGLTTPEGPGSVWQPARTKLW
ncbi:transmembrane amino acid transporter protein-domain-containing protein, partial [Blyttiomyces helicus]